MKYKKPKKLIKHISKISDMCLQKYKQILNMLSILPLFENKNIQKCESIVRTELLIYFISIADIAADCIKDHEVPYITPDILTHFFGDDDTFIDLFTNRFNFYYSEPLVVESDIPHFWLQPNFDMTELDPLSRVTIFFTDIIFQDTVIEDYSTIDNLYDLPLEYLGMFAALMLEFSASINTLTTELFRKVKNYYK